MTLQKWQERVPEEAHLFNPAFCGALLYEFIRSYTKAKDDHVDFPLPFCALPLALHPASRDRLPYSTVTSLYTWLEENADMRVDYAARARSLAPYVREALRFTIGRNAIALNANGQLQLGSKRASFPDSYLDGMTPEIKEIVTATRKVARWFGAAGETATIMTAWGVRL